MDKIHYFYWTRYTSFAGQVSHGKRVTAQPSCPVSWDAGVSTHDNTRHALPMGSVSVGSGEASGAVKADRSGVLGVRWVAMNPRRVRGISVRVPCSPCRWMGRSVRWHQACPLTLDGALDEACDRSTVGVVQPSGWPRAGAADPVEFVEVPLLGVGQSMKVLLGGGDLGMTHTVHHRLGVGPSGDQPGGVSVAQVVDPYVEVHPRRGDGASPNAGAEGVPREGGALSGGEQQVTLP